MVRRVCGRVGFGTRFCKIRLDFRQRRREEGNEMTPDYGPVEIAKRILVRSDCKLLYICIHK